MCSLLSPHQAHTGLCSPGPTPHMGLCSLTSRSAPPPYQAHQGEEEHAWGGLSTPSAFPCGRHPWATLASGVSLDMGSHPQEGHYLCLVLLPHEMKDSECRAPTCPPVGACPQLPPGLPHWPRLVRVLVWGPVLSLPLKFRLPGTGRRDRLV